MDPRIAVVVATRDRCQELLRTLDRLAALPERPRVVVVDNGSTDGTASRVREAHPEVILLPQERNLGAAARTPGTIAAGTPYVAFCDDDSWWEPGALAAAADLLDASPDVALLAARVELEGGRLEPVCEAMADSPLRGRDGLPGPPVRGFVACGAIVRRDAYLAAGGFPPGLGVGGEEVHLAAALADRGWELVYVDALLAQHRPSPRRDTEARRRIAARSDLAFAWRRRAPRAALRETARTLPVLGPVRTVRTVAAALRERRPVGPRTERELALLTSGRPSGSSG
jgi:GT2 family glycosyltransferase